MVVQAKLDIREWVCDIYIITEKLSFYKLILKISLNKFVYLYIYNSLIGDRRFISHVHLVIPIFEFSNKQ